MRLPKFAFQTTLLTTISTTLLSPLAYANTSSPPPVNQSLSFDHLLTVDNVLDLIEAIESGELEKRCTPKDLDKINQFLVFLAKEGLLKSDNEQVLEEDIEELFSEEEPLYRFSLGEEMLFSYQDDNYMIIPCGWFSKNWKRTKKFIRRHKKEVIIGSVIVVAAAIITATAIVASSAAAEAASLAAGAVGAATSSGSNKEASQPASAPEATLSTPPPDIKPPNPLQPLIEEQLSAFKDLANEDIALQDFDYANIQKDPNWRDKLKGIGAVLAHETLDGVSEITSIAAQINQEIKDISSKVLPKDMLPTDLGNPKENYDSLIAKGHQVIDKIFSTNAAYRYTPEAKAKDPFTIGILPPPTILPKSMNVKKIIQSEGGGVGLLEEPGLASRQITELKEKKVLEDTIDNTLRNYVKNHEIFKSETVKIKKPVKDLTWYIHQEKFKEVQEILKTYKKVPLSEEMAKEILHDLGIPTFPRPQGIPDNYVIKFSDKGAGIKYVHPEDSGTYVRVMPGKPYSPLPLQKEPYVVQMQKGGAFDLDGNLCSRKDPKVHIPLEDFIYRDN